MAFALQESELEISRRELRETAALAKAGDAAARQKINQLQAALESLTEQDLKKLVVETLLLQRKEAARKNAAAA
jgi:hypothetical protein